MVQRRGFEKDETVTSSVNAVFDVLCTYRPGDVVPWAELERAAGVSRNSSRGGYVIAKARKRFRIERHCVTWGEHGSGIRILTEREKVKEQVPRRFLRSFRQIGRGLKESETVNTAALSQHEIAMHAMQVHTMNDERKSLRRAMKQSRAFLPAESLPKKQIAETV